MKIDILIQIIRQYGFVLPYCQPIHLIGWRKLIIKDIDRPDLDLIRYLNSRRIYIQKMNDHFYKIITVISKQ